MNELSHKDFWPGLRCEITSADRFSQKDIGKFVVVVRVNPETGTVWTHDDEPPKYRTNRKGRRVTVYNPKNIHSPRSIRELTPAPIDKQQ